MRAAWWWIDRWRKSTAYTHMTFAEQGAYRNLLDELWLRDGLLPNDDRVLGNIAGDRIEWGAVRDVVLQRFRVTPEGLRNDTHDEIMAESTKRAARQKRYRDRNVTHNVAPSPSPDQSPDQDKSPKRKTPPTPSRGFGCVWEAFPVKKGKIEAEKAYRQLKPNDELQARIIERIALFSTSDSEWARGFVPRLSSFLRGRMWEEEPRAPNGTVDRAELVMQQLRAERASR